MLETAAFIGLLVPSGPTILFAAFLASTRFFQIEHVLIATLLGGFTGDQIGYWLGRTYGARGMTTRGRIGRMWQRHEPRAIMLFRRHSILAVSFARCIAFVRTIMPWFAGMSRMPYGRFVSYDAAGVLVWGGAHVIIGYTAGQSWRLLASILGSATLALFIIVATVTGLILLRRRRAEADLPAEDDTRVPGLFRVGLTGNIASGKSTVAAEWQALGAVIVDADDLAREAVAPGTEGLARVTERFGAEVLQPDGSLDRVALRALVFDNEQERLVLESILHPEIERRRIERERELLAAGTHMVVHAIPLLFEVGMEAAFDLIVLVHADEAERLRRLTEDRGLPEADARHMIEAQMPSEDKREHAAIVIDNNGTLDELRENARTTWQEIERRAAAFA